MGEREENLFYHLQTSRRQIKNIYDELNKDESKYYQSWEEPKKNNGKNGKLLTRTVQSPNKKLKRLQKKILHNVLYKRISLPPYFFGGVKGKDSVLNARYHQGNKFFFQTDLKTFFPSISSKQVYSSLLKSGFNSHDSRFITRLCTKSGSIPQGCPTSSFLASLFLYVNCDDIIRKYLGKGFKVSVYVDDITFSKSSDFKNLTQNILNDLRSKGLKINFDKTTYTKYADVTGTRVKNNLIKAKDLTYEKAKDLTLKKDVRNGHRNRIKYIDKVSSKKYN